MQGKIQIGNNMKIKQLLFIIALPLLFACQKPDYPEGDSSVELSALKAFVYYDIEHPSQKQEADLMSGTVNRERGLISYTFPASDGKYTRQTLSRCHMEATIPTTASLEMLDAAGKSLSHGFTESIDLCNTTIYFRITAANGTSQNWQLTCKLQ